VSLYKIDHRATLPHVDEFRPAHNLKSLEGLRAALAKVQVTFLKM
jgi:uncharacterized protein with von Willebrand factor type A (vWA) domain